jgi:hypothetical protein
VAWRPRPKYARVNPSSPAAYGTCDRSGFIGNQQNLRSQVQWRGLRLLDTNLLVLPKFLDTPQRQLGTIILSPDPVPVLNARPENYPIDEIWPRLTQRGQPRYLQRSSCSRSLQQSAYYQQGAF